MPAGVTWPFYLKFVVGSAVMMMLGSQTVHMIYKPLEDMDKLVEQELVKLRQEHAAAKEEADKGLG